MTGVGYTVVCRSCGYRVLRGSEADANDVKGRHEAVCDASDDPDVVVERAR